MKTVGLTPDEDDEDVWWTTCGEMYDTLVIYEYLKCKFKTDRIWSVIYKMKNSNQINPGIGWELFRKRKSSNT